jgi:hypothetical protein
MTAEVINFSTSSLVGGSSNGNAKQIRQTVCQVLEFVKDYLWHARINDSSS